MENNFICPLCGYQSNRQCSISKHINKCKKLTDLEREVKIISQTIYTTETYNIFITYKMIKLYKEQTKTSLTKKFIQSIYKSHKNSVKQGKKLVSIKHIVASINNYIIAGKSEKAKIAQRINGPKNLKKGRENYPEKFKEASKNNLKNWKENHPNEYKNAQIKGGINSYNNQLKDKIAEHPEWREKGQKIGTIAMKKYWDEHPEEKAESINKMIEGSKLWKKQHPEECSKNGKRLNEYINSIPGFREKSCKKARDICQQKIESGEINPFCSKEENRCKLELENQLKVKFDKYIKIKNPETDSNFGSFHPYDFGLKTKKLLIEYDGEYWHSLPNNIKRDEYWTKVAIDLGYTLIRINSKDWKDALKKEKIIENIRNLIEK